MNRIYFCSLRIKKRDILLVMLSIIIIGAGVVCRVAAYENKVASAVSWKVANRVIVIDPGHGGIDPGAVGRSGTLEKEVVLQVAQQLKELLSNAGAVVILTRETDRDLSNSQTGSLYARKRNDLTRRVELANENQADIYVSLHSNSFPSAQWSGAQTFYLPQQKQSKLLAEHIQGEIKRLLKNTKREALAEDFFTLRQTKMPAVIVELGFLSNPREEKLLIDDKYQQQMAEAIYSGIAKYFSEIGASGRK